jgi:predicted ATP-dependent protease
MAVGGVTRKIEGFFDLCVRRGLTGRQGVIIPHDNTDHLMLKYDVLKEVDAGKFAIYPVRHITEALELLTGIKTGNRRKDGSFTPDSLYHKVDRRLAEMGRLATRAFRSR